MASYITAETVVGIVAGLLSSITKPVYLHSRPEKVEVEEYVVVNAFAAGEADVMQKFIVNVNYHVRDIATNDVSGIADHTALKAGSEAVLEILKKVTATNYNMDFEKPEIFREPSFGEHYSNLRFKFNYINS